jgi:hypothetical protein
MTRKLFVAVAIASLMSAGIALSAHSVQSQPDRSDKQEQKATKSISGKITNIGNGGHSFTLEVAGANNKTIDFVVDKNTQVNGQVKQGTAVTVEYQAMENGQNLAVTVTANA